MIKLKDILKSTLLTEGRKEDMYNKYKTSIEDERSVYDEENQSAYDYFINHDTIKDTNYKYLPWLMKMNYTDFDHDFGYGDLLGRVNVFHNLNQYFEKKDLNQYTPEELDVAVDVALAKDKEKTKENALRKQRDQIYSDDRWTIIVPKTHEASCSYGSGTRWCTTMRGSGDYFRQYTRNAILFYMIDKTSTADDNVMYKVALNWRFGSNSDGYFIAKPITSAVVYDSSDKNVNINHILPLLPKEMVSAMTEYYNNVIKKNNTIIDETKLKEDRVFIELQESLKERGLSELLKQKFEQSLSNEHVTKINSGLEELTIDGESFSFSFNKYTGREDSNFSEMSEDNPPLFSCYLMGDTMEDGIPSLVEYWVHTEDGDVVYRLNVPLDDRWIWKNTLSQQIITDVTVKDIIANENEFFNVNLNNLATLIYNQMLSIAVRYSWNPNYRGDSTSITTDDKVYWVPHNNASTFTFKYPPKKGSVIQRFVDGVKNNPGFTPREFYDEMGKEYYAGHNTQFFGSIKDSGILRAEKGPYGELKYYLGPNYEAWTEGNLERYREIRRPWRWRR